MRPFICLIASCLFFISAFAQSKTDSLMTKTDTIEIKGSFLGNRFWRDGTILENKKIKSILKDDPLAYRQWRGSSALTVVSQAMTFAGIGGIFLSLIPYFTGGSGAKLNVPYALAGGGLLLGAISIGQNARCMESEAVHTYNKSHPRQVYKRQKPEYYLGFSGSSLGLIVKF